MKLYNELNPKFEINDHELEDKLLEGFGYKDNQYDGSSFCINDFNETNSVKQSIGSDYFHIKDESDTESFDEMPEPSSLIDPEGQPQEKSEDDSQS